MKMYCTARNRSATIVELVFWLLFRGPHPHVAMRFLSSLAPLTLLASCVASAGIVPRDTTKMSRGLMAGFLDIDPVPASEFDPFFDNDHFPRLFKVPGFLSNSRFDAIDGQQPEQVTLYGLYLIYTTQIHI